MNMYHTTKRLILRVLPPYYYQQVLEFYIENKEHFEPWEAEREKKFYTPSFQKALLEAEYNLIIKSKMIRFYAFLKENPDKVVGSVSVTNIQRGAFQSCSIGYKIHKDCCNLGLGKEAVKKVKDIVFYDCKLHRIEALVHPENAPSIALLEALEFKREGLAMGAAKIRGGWQDMYRYAMINQEERKESTYG